MKHLILTLLIGLFILNAQAADEEWKTTNAWEFSGFSQVWVTYPDKSFKTFQAAIKRDDKDRKDVVIGYYDSISNQCENRDGIAFGNAVIKVEGEQVEMTIRCGSSGLSYHATNERGRIFLVLAFSQEQPVSIAIQGYVVNIPSAGFNRAWVHGTEVCRNRR